jgi:hypothetical protein
MTVEATFLLRYVPPGQGLPDFWEHRLVDAVRKQRFPGHKAVTVPGQAIAGVIG